MGHKSPTTVRGTPATRLANGNYVCCAPHIYSHTHTHIRKESANNQHVTNIKKKERARKKSTSTSDERRSFWTVCILCCVCSATSKQISYQVIGVRWICAPIASTRSTTINRSISSLFLSSSLAISCTLSSLVPMHCYFFPCHFHIDGSDQQQQKNGPRNKKKKKTGVIWFPSISMDIICIDHMNGELVDDHGWWWW